MRIWIRKRLSKGQLNIYEEAKIGNNQALGAGKVDENIKKWPG